MTDPTDGSTPLDEVARRANVPSEFVRRLASLGALSEDPLIAVERELGRVRLLHAWSQAGFPPETIMRLVDQEALSITFLDAPAVRTTGRLDRRYEDIASERGVPEPLVERVHESIGFEAPDPRDRAGDDDLALLDVMELFRGVGVPDAAVLRLFAVYADAAHRLAKAEAELYEANIEERLRASGMTERELIEFGTELGNRITAALERALVGVYRRHRVHAWIEHSVNHVEAALDAEGIESRWERHLAMRDVTVTWVDGMREDGVDISVLAPEGHRSPTVTCITLPETTTGPDVVAAMRDRGWVIGGGYGRLKETSIRIGHMGDHTVDVLRELLEDLGEVLR